MQRWLVFIFILLSQQVHATTPNVVTTIKPLHSLVSNLMKGVAQPRLLVDTQQSPHHYSLKPSQRKMLAEADLIIWIGPTLESFLPRILHSLDAQIEVITLIENTELTRLPQRQAGHDHGDHEDHPLSTFDAHIWMNTRNLEVMATQITRALVKTDPAHAEQYQSNLQALVASIDALRVELHQLIAATNEPFLAYHDAYQYFENEFGLNNAGFVATNPELQPSARRVQMLKNIIGQQSIHCVFYDAPVEPPIVKTLVSGTRAHAVELDPTGIRIDSNEQLVFRLLRSLGENMTRCLKAQ